MSISQKNQLTPNYGPEFPISGSFKTCNPFKLQRLYTCCSRSQTNQSLKHKSFVRAFLSIHYGYHRHKSIITSPPKKVVFVYFFLPLIVKSQTYTYVRDARLLKYDIFHYSSSFSSLSRSEIFSALRNPVS